MKPAALFQLLLWLLLALPGLAQASPTIQYRCAPGLSAWQPLPAPGKLHLLETDHDLQRVCQVRVYLPASSPAPLWMTLRGIPQSTVSSEPAGPHRHVAPQVWRSARSAALALQPGDWAQARLDMHLPIGSTVQISMEPPADMLAQESRNAQIRSALLTLLFAMGLVSGMFAYALRDATTGWYTGLTLMLALLWSLLSGHAISPTGLAISYPQLSQALLLGSYGLALFTGLRFSLGFTNLQRHAPRLARYLRGLGWLVLGYTLMGLVPALAAWVAHYYNLVALVTMLAMLLPGLISLRAGDFRGGGFYLAGWSPIVLIWCGVLLLRIDLLAGYPAWLGQLSHGLQAIGLLPDWIDTAHTRQAAFLLQAVIFSLALADRAARLRHSRERATMTDRTTGLANRSSFLLDGDQLLAQDNQRARTLVLFDIAGFAAINETLGYDIGDRVLQETAERLRRKLGPNSPLARVGGNQFATLLDDGASAGSLQLLASTLTRQPLVVDEQQVDIRLRLAGALYPAHGNDIELLMRRAEIALGHAKQEKLHAQVYHGALERDLRFQLSLMSALRASIAQNQLQLYLQPKVVSRTGLVTGAEVLLRWQHPTLGLVSPHDFLPYAEKTGLIVELTRWVLVESLKLAKHWQLQGEPLRLSLNLSAADLADPSLPAYVAEFLQHSKANPHLLTLEITESEVMRDPKLAISSMQALRTLGFQLALDDFGTGNSSLAYLQAMPVSEIKIDRSFVINCRRNPQGATLIRAIVALSHTLGLKTIVEGVENEEEWHLACDTGCDEIQGYLLSPPLPVAAFEEWLLLNQPYVVPERQPA